ncbi:MAG: EamA family transporter [Bacteroidota bacterium]
MKFSRYYGAALLAFIVWGFFSLALKPLNTYPSLDILFYRVFFCAALMLIISLFLRKKVLKNSYTTFKNLSKKDKSKTVLLTFFGGALLTANWFFFIYAMNHISIKAASYAYLVCPIITTVLAYFILHEKLSKWQWLAVGISVVSCFLLSFNNLVDLYYSLIVAVSYALYLITQRKNILFDRFLLLTFQIIFAAFILLPFYPSYSGAVPQEAFFYEMIMIIVILFTIIPLFLNLYALQGVNSSTMGILLYINPLLNFLIAVFYFDEKTNSFQIFSYSLILLSIIIFNEKHIFRRKKVNVLS